MAKEMTLREAAQLWLSTESRCQKSHARNVVTCEEMYEHLDGPLSEVPKATALHTGRMLDAGRKPGTVNRKLAVVKRILKAAYERGDATEDFSTRIRLLKVKDEREAALTHEQVEALASACTSPEVGRIVRVLAYTGMRRGEYFAATAKHVTDTGLRLTADITKTDKPRFVPFPEPLRPVKLPGVRVTQLRRQFETARKRVGLPDLRLHDLRHACARFLAQSGANLGHVRDILGHANLKTTSRYLNLWEEDVADASDKMGEHIGAPA